ncbi:adenylyl-sulfate kinase [Salipaludibacillus keqinensis]|uniref:Adenylyl-sulfate kinase n=1 Tax=Salipaludibacillus keqinensis TaxID=2045207 RepID=A0A323TBF1_9BACI|nr:adenylyl-sulfate kinase [Salipaludibacillus keqinensis]PYZ91724.1 adenylyl-sulfate kinase [Salipaludibacillus keqinensis]
MSHKAANIHWHDSVVTKHDRQQLRGHKSCIIWFTGLSGSGKSTLANAVDRSLHQSSVQSYVLDGDNIRHGLNRDLGFKPEDRQENIRRIGEVSKLFVDGGSIVLTAFVSPYREDRQLAREMVEQGEFIEIYVKCPVEECENRDPKGLYKKARNGEIPEFTGISAPYEEPVSPELTISSDLASVEDSVETIITYLKEQQII